MPLRLDCIYSGRAEDKYVLLVDCSFLECRKTQTKVIIPTNHNKRKQHNAPIRNQNSKQMHATGAKRGKTRASEARLVLFLLLIG